MSWGLTNFPLCITVHHLLKNKIAIPSQKVSKLSGTARGQNICSTVSVLSLYITVDNIGIKCPGQRSVNENCEYCKFAHWKREKNYIFSKIRRKSHDLQEEISIVFYFWLVYFCTESAESAELNTASINRLKWPCKQFRLNRDIRKIKDSVLCTQREVGHTTDEMKVLSLTSRW